MNHPALTIRADLAHLQPQSYQVIVPTVALREKAGTVGNYDSELYFGETFQVYEVKDGRAWGRNFVDGYVGFVEAAALQEKVTAPTHRIVTLGAFVYPAATMKAIPLARLPLGAYVTATGAAKDNYLPVSFGGQAGYVYAPVARDISYVERDFAGVASRLKGVPYLWGGRTSDGIDCSGLVQLALSFCGADVPKDTDMQEPFFKPYSTGAKIGRLVRGDIIYFPGHVGIMVDSQKMLHANATSMDTRVNDLRSFMAEKRLAVTSVIHLPADLSELNGNRAVSGEPG